MKRRHRLLGARAFATVRARRASGAGRAVRVSVAPNGGDSARIGLAVPRSAGGAVIRNRIRRRLRALMAPRLPGLAGTDIVLSAGAAAAALPWQELGLDVDRALGTARRRLDAGAPRDGRTP